MSSDSGYMEATTTHKVKIPARFYWDHVDRDLPGGSVVSHGARYVTVHMTDAELAELVSDASYYADGAGGDSTMWSENRGLIMSARATLRAVERQTGA